MQSRQILREAFFAVLLLSVLCAGAMARDEAPEKVAVVDGHVVHDVGNLWQNVTNWGQIGSTPGTSATWSDAPSAMWPAGSGNEYLWAAGLWVGGVVLGERLVTTGGSAYQTEFASSDAEGDTIFPTHLAAIGGMRYPWPDADDDGDGLEDEETLNGLDDDGDGEVDEDYAGMGDQEFVATYRDNEASIQESRPDHTPLNIEVVQRSMQWSNPLGDDFVGYDFTITNIGVADIEAVYLGLFSDCDIGPLGNPVAEDDYAGSWRGSVRASNGEYVPVQVAYMYDGADTPIDGYVGWVLLGHSVDVSGSEMTMRTFQRCAGQVEFARGGDPTNDDERYQLLSAREDYWDQDVLPGQQSDYRILTSSGPFPALVPEASLHYAVAIVLGVDLDAMLDNAAEAILTYRGVSYDRDGDPGNGAEFDVRWIRPDEAPVASLSGSLAGHRIGEGVELRLETNADSMEDIALVRRESRGVPERMWSSGEFTRAGRIYSLVDTDDVGWPRDYELVYVEGGAQLTLDKISLSMPAVTAAAVEAAPNPFNPQVNLTMRAAAADRALLRIFDVRGRCVATLHDGPFAGGERTLTWDGRDHAGRAQASGVYEVRLETESEIVQRRITLLR